MIPCVWRILPYLALAGVAACTTYPQYQPKVDMAGHTARDYEYDLDVCRENARQLDILKGVGIGVIAGTLMGAGIGSVTGDAGIGAATGVAGGTLAGAAAGSLYEPGKTALVGTDPHAAEIRQCLQERGYTVLEPGPTAGADVTSQ